MRVQKNKVVEGEGASKKGTLRTTCLKRTRLNEPPCLAIDFSLASSSYLALHADRPPPLPDDGDPLANVLFDADTSITPAS